MDFFIKFTAKNPDHARWSIFWRSQSNCLISKLKQLERATGKKSIEIALKCANRCFWSAFILIGDDKYLKSFENPCGSMREIVRSKQIKRQRKKTYRYDVASINSPMKINATIDEKDENVTENRHNPPGRMKEKSISTFCDLSSQTWTSFELHKNDSRTLSMKTSTSRLWAFDVNTLWISQQSFQFY